MQLLLKAPGVKQITRSEIEGYAVPTPTASYTPVSNQLIIETALEQFDKEGFNVVGEFYKHSTCSKFVGGIILDGTHIDPEYNFEFAFKNSYDRTMSVGIGLGTNVFVCSNSAVSAEFVLKRVHTGGADKVVEEYIRESIKELFDTYMKITGQLNGWKEIETTKRLCAETVGRLMLEDKIISPNQFAIIRDELEKESFNYGVEDSVYNLYQACTHALKTEAPISFIKTHAQLHEFFVENFN